MRDTCPASGREGEKIEIHLRTKMAAPQQFCKAENWFRLMKLCAQKFWNFTCRKTNFTEM